MAGDSLNEVIALHALGRSHEAIRLCQSLLLQRPDDPNVLYLLAGLAYETGDDAEALRRATETLRAGAEVPEVHNLMGLAHLRQSRPADAESSFGRCVALNPDFAPGWLGLGQALHAQQRTSEALTALRKSAELAPAHAPTFVSLADALQTLGRLHDALPEYRRALAIDPALASARYGLGCAQLSLGLSADAAESFAAVLEAFPAAVPARHNLGRALLETGRVSQALAAFRAAAAAAPDPQPRVAMATAIPGDPAADHPAILAARRTAGAIWPQLLAARPRSVGDGLDPSPDGSPRSALDRPLRIGYLSAFFDKPNWMKPVWALINRHDRGRFAVHLFSDVPPAGADSPYRPHATDTIHATSHLDNARLAAAIAAAKIDVLVDLNAFSATERLGVLPLRAAPVAVGWFNWYATSGMDGVDALIGDRHVVRPEEEPFYSERIVRVEGTYLTFEVAYPVPDVAPPPCTGGGGFTFGSLASLYKLTPEVLDAWAQVLRRCPVARLLVRNTGLSAECNRRYLAGALMERGIEEGRFELLGQAPHEEFLRTYDRIDVALDPFPYNGGTTTTEAIWQGVPVLTFDGDRWASRTSASLLREGGLGEFVAPDLAGHVEQAVALAADPATPDRLADLRPTMRDRLLASPATACDAFTRRMETLYLDLLASPPARA